MCLSLSHSRFLALILAYTHTYTCARADFSVIVFLCYRFEPPEGRTAVFSVIAILLQFLLPEGNGGQLMLQFVHALTGQKIALRSEILTPSLYVIDLRYVHYAHICIVHTYMLQYIFVGKDVSVTIFSDCFLKENVTSIDFP